MFSTNCLLMLLLENSTIRRDLEEGRPILDMETDWKKSLDEWLKIRSEYLIYPSTF